MASWRDYIEVDLDAYPELKGMPRAFVINIEDAILWSDVM